MQLLWLIFAIFQKKKKGERWDISIHVKRYGKTDKKYSSIGQDIYILDQEVELIYIVKPKKESLEK